MDDYERRQALVQDEISSQESRARLAAGSDFKTLGLSAQKNASNLHRAYVVVAFEHDLPRLAASIREINTNLVRLRQTVKKAAWVIIALLLLVLLHLW